jgi:hypothetical protein
MKPNLWKQSFIKMTPFLFTTLFILSWSIVQLNGFYIPNCRFLQKIKLPNFSFLSFFEKDENEKRKKEMEKNKIDVFRQYHVFNENENNKNENEIEKENTDDLPLYTIVWYDCKECRELLQTLEATNCKKVFLDLTECVQEFKDMNNYEAIEKPFFYKNEDYLGDDLFDFYEHLIRENIL